MAWWRAMGMNYLKVSQIQAAAAKQALKKELQPVIKAGAEPVVITKH